MNEENISEEMIAHRRADIRAQLDILMMDRSKYDAHFGCRVKDIPKISFWKWVWMKITMRGSNEI